MIEFTAGAFQYEENEEDEYYEAAAGESARGGGIGLMIQRTTYEPEEQDIRAGLDTYCLVNGALVDYGGVVRATRTGAVLDLELTAGAAEVLRLDERLRIHLDGEEGAVETFFTGLRRVLDWGRADARPELVGF